jgi:hypothetical protein
MDQQVMAQEIVELAIQTAACATQMALDFVTRAPVIAVITWTLQITAVHVRRAVHHALAQGLATLVLLEPD